MSGPVQRQPWFWAILTAVAGLFIFSIVIVAANRSDGRTDSTTVVQQPSSKRTAELVPVPVPQAPAPPQRSTPPAPPSPPPPVRERTIIIREEDPSKPTFASQAAPPVAAPRPKASRMQDDGTRVTEFPEFRSTGLPVEIQFDEQGWKATEERAVIDAATELKSIGTTEDGADVWVPTHAVEPYDQVLVAVLDEEGKYVVYRKRR